MQKNEKVKKVEIFRKKNFSKIHPGTHAEMFVIEIRKKKIVLRPSGH